MIGQRVREACVEVGAPPGPAANVLRFAAEVGRIEENHVVALSGDRREKVTLARVHPRLEQTAFIDRYPHRSKSRALVRPRTCGSILRRRLPAVRHGAGGLNPNHVSHVTKINNNERQASLCVHLYVEPRLPRELSHLSGGFRLASLKSATKW